MVVVTAISFEDSLLLTSKFQLHKTNHLQTNQISFACDQDCYDCISRHYHGESVNTVFTIIYLVFPVVRIRSYAMTPLLTVPR